MVLFIFVIMLLNLQSEKTTWKFDFTRGVSFIVGIAFFGEIFAIIRHFQRPVGGDFAYARVESIGQLMTTDYLFPFETISVVLLAALVGAIVVAKRHIYEQY